MQSIDRVDDLAMQFGVSSARVCQLKRELGEQVKLRWGNDALQNATREPKEFDSISRVK